MKTLQLLALTSLAAAAIALVWQAHTITELRAEVGALRTDLRTSLESALDNPAGLSSEAEQARREKLELIRACPKSGVFSNSISNAVI
jgi:hypothetical protein